MLNPTLAWLKGLLMVQSGQAQSFLILIQAMEEMLDLQAYRMIYFLHL